MSVAEPPSSDDDGVMDEAFDEFDLIARIRATAGSDPRVPLGIGDDAAVLQGASGGRWLVAADMLLEGRHFEIATATPQQIGRKALAVNLSDLAAMAGRPVAAFVTVAHHRRYGTSFAKSVHAGIARLADEFQVVIAGGDTNVWDGPLVVSVTLFGEIVGDRAVSRHGARPGDRVFVTGPLGGSLRSGRHLSFPPRQHEAQALHTAVDLHAMIDVSDGLVADLGHICEQSGVAAILHADAIPIAAAVERDRGDSSPVEHALTDGEDFELAFCVGPDDADRLRRNPPNGVVAYEVGEIVPGDGVRVLDATGESLSFNSTGWKHRW
ncbi:MAG: thiamine-phosphate kinase [Planctomycetaceae bacterium]